MTNNEALALAIAELERKLDAIDEMLADKRGTTFVLHQHEYWSKLQARFSEAIAALEKMRGDISDK